MLRARIGNFKSDCWAARVKFDMNLKKIFARLVWSKLNRKLMLSAFGSILIFLLLSAGIMYAASLYKRDIVMGIAGFGVSIMGLSESSMEELARQIIMQKAQGTAEELRIYTDAKPEKKISELEANEEFRNIAFQNFGKTGYTEVHSTEGIILVNADSTIEGKSLRELKDSIPGFWEIIEVSLSQDETGGYYKSQDASGKEREVYMHCSRARGTKFIVCAEALAGETLPMQSLLHNELSSFLDEAIAKVRGQSRALSLLIGSALAVIFAMAIASVLFIRAKVVKPINQLHSVTEKISEGNFNVRATIKTGDELEELGDSFNSMSKDLQNYKAKVESYNRELEKKIITRTKQLNKNQKELYKTMAKLDKTNSRLENEKKNVQEKVKHRTEELEKAYDTLKALNKRKEEFVSIMTHEMKAPLFPIMGYTDLILKGKMGKTSKKQKEKIGVIAKSAANLNKLVYDMLDMSKIELHKMKLDIAKEDLADIAKESQDEFALKAREKKIGIKLECPARCPAYCDRKRIVQVINNLVGNAIKFAPEKGLIIIGVKKEKESAVVSIKDNGIGISKEDQKRLFKRFSQVRKGEAKKVSGGTGLGLAISKGIVELHHGRIWVESEPGKGSTFIFTIPLGKPKALKKE